MKLVGYPREGAAAGYPFDSVKVRLQASQRGTYSGPADCFRHILRSEGIRGLYRGLSVPLVGGIVETGMAPQAMVGCMCTVRKVSLRAQHMSCRNTT